MISDNKKAFYCLGKKRLCSFWLYRFELIRNGSKMNETVVSPLGMTQKSVVSPFSSFGKEEWSKTEVVGEIMFVPISL